MYVLNGRAARGPYGADEAAIVSIALARPAYDEMRGWPDYAPTPLASLPACASLLGVEQVLYKDESARFGLGSFKALGGAYAAKLAIEEALAELKRPLHLCCATDGNHGRSVALAARAAAGLQAACRNSELRAALGLSPDARVLVFGAEGD